MATPQKSNSSGKKKKWKPAASVEARRLGNAEDDWSLPGSEALPSKRSRFARPRRILLGEDLPPTAACLPCNKSDTDSAVSSLTDGSSSTSSRSRRPPHVRVIIETDPVASMLQEFLKDCPSCGKPLEITFPTTCLASSCRLQCSNIGLCTWATLSKPSPVIISALGLGRNSVD